MLCYIMLYYIYIYNLLSACPITLVILHACRIRLQQVLFFLFVYMNCYCSVCVVGCSYVVCSLVHFTCLPLLYTCVDVIAVLIG